MHKIIVFGQKNWTLRVTKPWTHFEFPTNSNQQQSNLRICYFFVLWYVAYAQKLLWAKEVGLQGLQNPAPKYLKFPTNSK